MIKSNRVSHICIIDEERSVYLENNDFLKGLTFIGGKLEKEDGGNHKKAIIRETLEETQGILKLKETDLIKIEENTEEVNGINWNGILYGIKISSSLGQKLIENTRGRIKKVLEKDLYTTEFSKKIEKARIIMKIKLTITTIENEKI